MKGRLLISTIMIGLVSCQSKQQATGTVSTIDSTLQTNATAILGKQVIRDKCPIWAGYSYGSSDRAN